MAWRTALGAVWIAALGLILFLDQRYGGRVAPLFVVLALAITWCGAHELVGLLRNRCSQVSGCVVCTSCLLVVASASVAHWPTTVPPGQETMFWPMATLAGTTMGVLLAHSARYRQGHDQLEPLAAEVFSIAYIGGLLSFAGALRWVPVAPGEGMSLLPLLSLLITTKGTDTAAYCTGKLLGRRRLAPELSPGKTVEGAVGGLIGAVVTAVLLFRILPKATSVETSVFSWDWTLGFGLAVGVAGQAGDLAESMIKRATGQKDSSRLMPGLGGVLDLLDSLLFAAPVVYVFWCFR